jgi:hypothetical protein
MGIFPNKGFQYWQVEFGEFAYFGEPIGLLIIDD